MPSEVTFTITKIDVYQTGIAAASEHLADDQHQPRQGKKAAKPAEQRREQRVARLGPRLVRPARDGVDLERVALAHGG